MTRNTEKPGRASFDERLEKLMMRERVVKFRLWQALLLLLAIAPLAVIYGMMAIDGGKPNANFLARGVHMVSIAPHLAMRAVTDASGAKNPRLARGQRFAGEAGWNVKSGAAPEGMAVALSRYDGDEKRGIVEFVDLNSGKTLHSWRPDVDAINGLSKMHEKYVNLARDFTPARYMEHHPLILEDGSLIYHGMDSPLVKVDACSRVVWTVDGDFHHSIERDADGNIWTVNSFHPPSIPLVGEDFDDDAIAEVSPAGEILFDKSVAGILIGAGLGHIIYSHDVYDQDPIHLNDVQPVDADGPYWKKGDLFLSLRNPSMLMLYRPSTDEIVWRRQGPWLMQHDVDVISDHEIAVYNNNTAATPGGGATIVSNNIVIYDLATGATREPFTEAFRKYEIHTETSGLFSLFPDGSVMIEEHDYGRLLALGPDGEMRWSYVNRAPKDGRVYHLGWSRAVAPKYAQSLKGAFAAAQCESPAP